MVSKRIVKATSILLAAALLAGSSNMEAEANSESKSESVDSSEIELDYAQGIADGIYGWTLSEDGSFYILSAINEDGTPVESTAKQGFMGGQGAGRTGDMPTDGNKPDEGNMPADGSMPDEGNMPADGSMPDMGDMPDGAGSGDKDFEDMDGNSQDALAMEDNKKASSVNVNAQGVYTESNVTNTEYQTMLVFVPADYMTINADGSAEFTDTKVGSYTAKTAPVVFQNSNAGWRSGSPQSPEYADALSAGMIYVSCGSRSRDAVGENGDITGKAPAPVVDLKAGVIALRANDDVIPGDKDKIISVGASGGGQMSSVLGASGNMEEYYPYLYEAGAIGVTYDEASNTYSSEYDDSVYADMAYCPIADIDNADLAYAWFHYDSTLDEDGSLSATAGNYQFSEFQLALQEDAAYAFAEYINSLNLTDENGESLSFDVGEDGKADPRSGSYYDATLKNISDALNAMLKTQDDPSAYIAGNYGDDTSSWLSIDADGNYVVTDLAAFINGTNLVRNKDIPGFDTFDMSSENDAFGTSDTAAVHFSASMAKLLQENYDKYKALDGFDADQVDSYIADALTGEKAEAIAQQTYLMNAAQILLDVANGRQDADIAKYWRTRNGTADQHTSFSAAYNITLAAQMAGADSDYALVWAMGHGSNEGTTTGTFVDWINEICAAN